MIIIAKEDIFSKRAGMNPGKRKTTREDGASSSSKRARSDPMQVKEAVPRPNVPPPPRPDVPPPPRQPPQRQPAVPRHGPAVSDDELDHGNNTREEDLGSLDSFDTKDYPNDPHNTDSDSGSDANS
ncbi:hypothetical protein V6N13_057947 [Hibiscus sabdariffa]|uniref:Uncharacterized protein n=1 Tax=Hibiscus sabdariffa TaxID=183260 RepID=A0ABR2GHL9_9ROSI